MSAEHHDLVHELPEHKDTIHTLKVNDPHFARLFEEYHETNREVLRMEEDIEPVSDETLEDRKKHRLALKDQLYSLILAAEKSA